MTTNTVIPPARRSFSAGGSLSKDLASPVVVVSGLIGDPVNNLTQSVATFFTLLFIRKKYAKTPSKDSKVSTAPEPFTLWSLRGSLRLRLRSNTSSARREQKNLFQSGFFDCWQLADSPVRGFSI